LDFSLLCLAAIWRLFAFIETAHRCRSMMPKKQPSVRAPKALKAFPDYLRGRRSLLVHGTMSLLSSRQNTPRDSQKRWHPAAFIEAAQNANAFVETPTPKLP
jgi:hypothetical protein